ncbi:MAG: DUF2461 domain-containing protein [Phycicoccus sp.]
MSGATTTFAGFRPEATGFLAGLAADNTREHWVARREVFEREVREPMDELLGGLPQRYHPFHVFRMNRDLRFSADKSPYKTMHGAAHDVDGSVHYVHLDPEGLMVAVGSYMLASDQLARFRAAIDAPGSGVDLLDIRDCLGAAGLTVGPGGAEPLRTAPRGYPPDHPRINLLRHKGVIASHRIDARDLGDGAAVLETVSRVFADAEPLHHWIAANVGASTKGRRR